MKHQVVIANLPRTGLGNMLHVWAKAIVFSYNNRLPVYINGWKKLRIGPYLRGERTKRTYGSYFEYETNHIYYYTCKILSPAKICYEPDIDAAANNFTGTKIFCFNEIPHVSEEDIFKPLNKHKDLIKSEFYRMIKEQLLGELKTLRNPEIGVHIRRGDFCTLNIELRDQYYIEKIQELRDSYGNDLSVSVFSDGYEKELQKVLSLQDTSLVQHSHDLIDLIHLSKSKYLVLTPRSTFSLWGHFLSNAKVTV